MSALWDSLEMQLLAACARARSDDCSAAAIRAITQLGAVDWRSLLVRAEFHGMLPLLYHHLSRAAANNLQVPAETMSHLRSSAQHLLQRSLFMTGHLLKIVRLLQEHGIAVIPIKGPVLAVRVYGDVGLRQHADLDILVDKEDIGRVKQLLATVGYQPEISRDANTEEIHLNSDKDLALFLESGICLEVHHALTPPYSFATMDMDGLHMRTTDMSLLGTKVRTMSAEDELLYLCLNGAAHCWSRLEYVCTLAELVRQNPHLDWIEIIRHARQCGSLQALYLGLHLGQRLLGAPLPPELASRAERSGSTRHLAASIRRQLNKMPPWSSNWENVWFILSIQDGVGRWLGSALRFATIPTGADAATFSLPRPLRFLYCVLRPFHLLYRYATMRRLKSRKASAEHTTDIPSWAQR